MITHDGSDERRVEVRRLETPELLERRLAPVAYCCGTWSYGFSFSATGPSFSITWTEEGECKGL